MTEVAITHNKDIQLAIREALSHLDIPSLVSGKIVALKPNNTWAAQEDITAVTQGDTLEAVIQFIKP